MCVCVCVCVCGLLIFSCNTLFSEECLILNRGQRYILPVFSNGDGNSDLKLYISSFNGVETNVKISAPSHVFEENKFDQEVIVAGTDVEVVTIPPFLRMIGSEKQANAVSVRSSNPVIIYSVNANDRSCGAYMNQPVPTLGFEYFAISEWPKPTYNAYSQLAVVSHIDETLVTIRFPKGRGIRVEYLGSNYESGDTLEVLMQEYQVLQLQDKYNNDLTGTYVVATNEISFYSGNTLSEFDTDDHIVEQIPPVNKWGKHFKIPYHYDIPENVIKCVTSQKTTTVVIENDEDIKLKEAGSHFEKSATTSSEYKSDKPMLCVLFTEELNTVSMTIIPPVEQQLSSYRFIVPDISSNADLLITADNNLIDGFFLDGESIPSTDWEERESFSNFKEKIIRVSSGLHIVRHKDGLTFGAYVYGSTDGSCLFSYPADLCMDTIEVSILLLHTLQI